MRNGLSQRITWSSRPSGSRTAKGSWDATKTEAPAELVQGGFQLAHFILPDRSIAIDILVRALEKVKVQSRREIKRLYWRDKHAERPVRRVARSDADMLQWLIMFESEQDERAQERTCNPSLRSMGIRYIKHLVQVTSALSSFYVNVGLTRLLRTYSTSETQRAYEMLTNRFLGADEYRRAKAALMDKMSRRFAGFVKITRVDHGEFRFETFLDQEQWAGLVDDCLKAFTPWSTQEFCRQLAAAGDNSKLRAISTAADADRNEMEMRCCHIFIEPSCYSRLLKELAFDPPDTKLAVPRFVMPEKQEKDGDDGTQLGRPPELSEEDLDKIDRRLAATDARRRNLDPRFVTIVIDGVERTRLDLTESRQWQIEIEAGAGLIEIRGEDDLGELVLATYLISYANNAFEFSSGTAVLSKGKLRLQVTPIATPGPGPARAMLSLNYSPTFRPTWLWTAWRDVTGPRRKIRSYALAGLTIALIGWGLAGVFYAHKARVLEQQLQQAQRHPQQLPPTAARAIVSYALISDDQRVRGPGSAGIPAISLRLHSSAVSLELPLSKTSESGNYSAELTTFTGDRTLLTQNFLQPRRTDAGWAVEIVLPADLLKPDTYYTVHLHASDVTDHFTFKVVAAQ